MFLTFSEVFFRWENYRNRNIETRACRRQSQWFHHELVPDSVCKSKYPEWDVEFKVNNLGFRDEDVSVRKSPDVYRVLLVGDSFIEGESVAENKTAANLAEKEITSETGRKVEVINMGVMSYAPAVYFRVIKDKGLPLNPDLVIVNVDMSDFQNDYAYAKDMDKDGNFQNILFQQQMGQPYVVLPAVDSKIKFWLRSNSALYAMVADRTKQLVRKIKKLPEPTVFLANNLDSDPHYITRSEENASNPEAWKEISANLIKIRDLLKQKIFPWQLQFILMAIRLGKMNGVKAGSKTGLKPERCIRLRQLICWLNLEIKTELRWLISCLNLEPPPKKSVTFYIIHTRSFHRKRSQGDVR